MDISESSLWREVQEVANSGPKPVHYNWRCEIHIGTDTLYPTKLINIDVKRQYNSQFSDETIIAVVLGSGTYSHKLWPQRDNIKVSLFKEPITEVAGGDNFDEHSQMRTYRGVLVQGKSDLMESKNNVTASQTDSDIADQNVYYIQLLDLAEEQLRMKTLGGIYRQMTTTEVIQGELTRVSGNLGLDDDSSIQGVDVVPGNNDQVREHIVVPHGTPVIGFPNYIQQHCGGVYSAEIGYYLQNGIWYVYPQYNLKRFTKEPRNLMLINVPPKRMPQVERSYYQQGDMVMVLGTGDSKHVDDSESQQLQRGNGVRYADANRILGDWRTVNGNRAAAKRSDNMRELYIKPRRNGLNQAPMSPRRITANPYYEVSQLARRVGTFMQVHWNNANTDVIYPGMPVRFVYMKDDTVVETYGIVSGMDHFIRLQGQGITSTRYICDAIVTLFLETDEPSA